MGRSNGSAVTQDGVVLGSRYLLRRQLATSGHSSVHLAVDMVTDTLVAVKFAERDNIAFLCVERRLLDEVQHPNVVSLLDWGACGEAEYLVLELANGGSLGKRMVRRRPDQRSTLGIGVALARALAAVHGRGYVHRDVKCSNMFIVGARPEADLSDLAQSDLAQSEATEEPGADLLGPDERVVLGDFGVAYRLGEGSGSPDRVGTPGFRAPEQWMENPTLSPAVDIYSATAVILSVVSGDMPPEGDELSTLVAGLRPEWRAFVERGMHPCAGQRHTTMAEWAGHLHAVMGSAKG